jgi:hypothetical protein
MQKNDRDSLELKEEFNKIGAHPPPATARNRQFLSSSFFARMLPSSTRLPAMSTLRRSALRFAAGMAVVPSPQPRSRTLSRSLTAVTHGCGDAGEVALFPQGFARIHSFAF